MLWYNINNTTHHNFVVEIMRKISNYNDLKLQEEQFDVLCEVFLNIKTDEDMRLCLASFLTKSEKAVLSQRLDIMRMLSKHFSYQDIREKINASPSTIATAKRCLEEGGEDLENILLSYKYGKKKIRSGNNNSNNFVRSHRPGAIKL